MLDASNRTVTFFSQKLFWKIKASRLAGIAFLSTSMNMNIYSASLAQRTLNVSNLIVTRVCASFSRNVILMKMKASGLTTTAFLVPFQAY